MTAVRRGTLFANLDAAVAEAPAGGWLPVLEAASSAEDRPATATTDELQTESRLAPVPARKASPCDAGATVTEFLHGGTTLPPASRPS